MADIARLGFSADTNDLKQAKADLETLVPSAKKAEAATNAFNKAAAGITGATGGGSGGIKSFASAAAGAATGTGALGRAALMAGTGLSNVQRAAAGAAVPTATLAANVMRSATAFSQADAHVQAYRNSLLGVPAAANNAASAITRMGAAANDNINAMQATPGNIAAQFQDIGVTAAAGMNPMLIALQQGTQLSAAMSGGLGNLLAGFRQMLSPVTLLTIGLVGLAAAGLQAVDWIAVAKGLMNGLADAMEAGAVAAAYLGVVLAIAFAPQIIMAIGKMTAGIAIGLVGALKAATLAMIAFAVANPFGFIVLAIGAVIGAMVLLNDAFGGAFSTILGMVKDVANGIIRFFAKAWNVVIRTAESAVNKLGSMFNTLADGLGIDMRVRSVSFDGAQINAGREDFLGDMGSWIADKAAKGAAWLRGKAAGLGAEDPKKKKVKKAAEGRDKITDAERAAKAYGELIESLNAEIAALQSESAALDMSANAAALYRNEQDLLAKALATGVPITEAVRAQMKGLAADLTDAQLDVEFKKIRNAAEEQILGLKDQADLIGLVGYQLEYTKARQELVNQAVKAGTIDLNNMNDAMRERLRIIELQAGEIATLVTDNAAAQQMQQMTLEGEEKRLTDFIAKQREQIEFYRETFDGFFESMLSGLRQGQSVWEAFGNAVMSVVNRIIDRLLDMGTNSLFDMLPKLLGVALPQARLVGDVNNTIAANPHLFAKGGAFTNGVFDQPTLFKFAKGGALGMMGEAGPEAVMPLKRGPDGSLGVQMHGGQQTVRVEIGVNDDRFNAYTDERAESAVARGAPAIASAGAQVAQKQSVFRQGRRIR